MKPQKFSVSVRELIEHRLLLAPAIARGEHRGTKVEATILEDGRFMWKNQVFDSPSVAAGRAITEITGFRTARRSYFSVNGWKFWHVQGQDGLFRSLAEIRSLLPDEA